MEEEVDEVVSPNGKHDPDHTAVGHGHEASEVPLGGRRVAVERPRAQTADDEADRARSFASHPVRCAGFPSTFVSRVGTGETPGARRGARRLLGLAALAVCIASPAPSIASDDFGTPITAYYPAGELALPACFAQDCFAGKVAAGGGSFAWAVDAPSHQNQRVVRFNTSGAGPRGGEQPAVRLNNELAVDPPGEGPVFGLAVATDGNLFVKSAEIHRYAANGVLLNSFSAAGSVLAPAPDGGVYVIGSDIQRYSSSGSTVGGAFGGGQLTGPVDAALAGDKLYVCDSQPFSGQRAVKVFTTAGAYVGVLGAFGALLSRPDLVRRRPRRHPIRLGLALERRRLPHADRRVWPGWCCAADGGNSACGLHRRTARRHR